MDYRSIMEQIIEYRNEREQKQSLTTKDCAISICINAANLLETIQCKADEETMQIEKTEILEKMAEFILPLLYMCHNLGITSDTMEATIYSTIIKGYNLTDKEEFLQNINNSKIIDFKTF
jgi:hypothetical protein